VVFTCAPADYDYPSTVLSSNPLPFLDARGRQWRVVSLEEFGASFQVGRWGSGLFVALSAAEWAEQVQTRDVQFDVDLVGPS
jgi:hypothetical protein